MAVARCSQGHFYDDEKYEACPHCENPPPQQRRPGADAMTVLGGMAAAVPAPGSRPQLRVQLDAPQGGDARTVGIFRTTKGMDPVVGWLVCIEGPERGRDWRLHAGRNFVGRALQSDVVLADDEQITRQDHCSIVFEPRRAVFALARGQGDGVLVNGERLQDTRELSGGEVLAMGAGEYVFIPFCTKERVW